MDAIAYKIKRFMEPRSVPLFGIFSKVVKGSLNIFENLIQLDLPGKVYLINPKLQEFLGQKMLPDVEEIYEDIDLPIIMTPRQIVPKILEHCVKKGSISLLIITQGFAEADEEGKALQSNIEQII